MPASVKNQVSTVKCQLSTANDKSRAEEKAGFLRMNELDLMTSRRSHESLFLSQLLRCGCQTVPASESSSN